MDNGRDIAGAGSSSRTPAMASVFREFEVEVRPEPPPPLVASDGRTAEDTLFSKLDLGKAGTCDEPRAVQ